MSNRKEGRLSLRHDEELLKRVREVAKSRGCTVSFLVDQFFRQLVEDERPKADEELGVEQA